MGEGVRVVPGGELEPADPTPGMSRARALQTAGMWSGTVESAPGAVSGWHHHGAHETTIYVVSGRLRLQFGPGGSEQVDAGPGDFVYVAPGAVHRELTVGTDAARAVLVRAGSGPTTVNVDRPE